MSPKKKTSGKQVELSTLLDTEPKALSRQSIPLKQLNEQPKKVPSVPPSTPRELILDYDIAIVPTIFPSLQTLDIPYIRKVGVRAAIEYFANVFHCKNFTTNLMQFWFLDIITDCVWRMQDEYNFPEHIQKIVLDWVLYFFNIIRAPHLNISRKEAFMIFEEALRIAENVTKAGVLNIPLPNELFSLKLDEDGKDRNREEDIEETKCSETDSSSSISFESIQQSPSYLAVTNAGVTTVYKMTEKTCTWYPENECLSTSVETVSDEELEIKDEASIVSSSVECEDTTYYQADMSTPPRFISSHTCLEEQSDIESVVVDVDEGNDDDNAEWIAAPKTLPKAPCNSQIFQPLTEDLMLTEKQMEEEAFEAWYDYHLWNLRTNVDNMVEEEIETVERKESIQGTDDERKQQLETIKNRLEAILNRTNDSREETERNIFINTCVIMAIKQFIFDYFYETFQFKLIVLAFRNSHRLATEELSKEWNIPKKFKGDFKRPKVKKPKKQKKKKEKKPKKGKSKSSKSKSKSKSKSSKKKSKSSKSSKRKKKEKHKLTKEEKEELERQKKERQQRAEEERIARENKMYMFPLIDAVSNTFFENIFENWEEPKNKKTKKKKKK